MNAPRVIAILATSRPQQEALRAVIEHVDEARLGASLPLWLDTWMLPDGDGIPDVVLLDMPGSLAGIQERLQDLRSRWPQAVWFAVGDVDQPQTIIEVMRAGVREYLERPLTAPALQDALSRLPAPPAGVEAETGERGRICLLGAHGGVGTTTIAVNLAVQLQRNHGSCLLVDLAPMGHAALHLNLKPGYGLPDALAHLERLDEALVNSLVIRHPSGLHLLAGSHRPMATVASDVVRLLERLQQHFRILVIDLSSRWDESVAPLVRSGRQTLLVTQADVVGLWSAARVRDQLGAESKLHLVLNRYRRQPGFDLKQAERAVHAPVLGTLPSAYTAISDSIAEGEPLSGRRGNEFARGCAGLAQELMPQALPEERRSWFLFRR